MKKSLPLVLAVLNFLLMLVFFVALTIPVSYYKHTGDDPWRGTEVRNQRPDVRKEQAREISAF